MRNETILFLFLAYTSDRSSKLLKLSKNAEEHILSYLVRKKM